MRKKIAVLAVLLSGSVASATPSVFVRGDAGAWWTQRMEARILGTAAGGVTTQRLSDFLEDTLIYGSYRVCSLEAVQNDTYVGLDRAAQAEINATLPHVAWRLTSATADGRRVLAQSVVFEGCDPDDPRGAALLITDAATNEIMLFQPMGDYGEGDDTYPAWVVFLSPKEGAHELLSYSTCTECGARTYVYYDVTRRRIYTEYNGH